MQVGSLGAAMFAVVCGLKFKRVHHAQRFAYGITLSNGHGRTHNRPHAQSLSQRRSTDAARRGTWSETFGNSSLPLLEASRFLNCHRRLFGRP